MGAGPFPKSAGSMPSPNAAKLRVGAHGRAVGHMPARRGQLDAGMVAPGRKQATEAALPSPSSWSPNKECSQFLPGMRSEPKKALSASFDEQSERMGAARRGWARHLTCRRWPPDTRCWSGRTADPRQSSWDGGQMRQMPAGGAAVSDRTDWCQLGVRSWHRFAHEGKHGGAGQAPPECGQHRPVSQPQAACNG